MALGDRIRALEAAHGARREGGEADARRDRTMDRMYHVLANARRELSGRDPLPTPEELRETREEILDTLSRTIPFYRGRGSWGHGEGKQFLDRWEDDLLEKLNELERGENDG